MKFFLFLAALIFSFSLFGNVFFDENVPEDFRARISEHYKKNSIQMNFLIEMPDEKTISIVAENGFVKTLPISEITVDDVINLMEEMVRVVYKKDENPEKANEKSEQLEKIKQLSQHEKEEFKEKFYENEGDTEKGEKPSKFINHGIKVAENVEFLPWVQKSDRFGISIFATSEERWAFGVKASVGVSFLRFGLRFKKGINLRLSDNSIHWESYGLNIQVDLLNIYNVRFSTAFEIALYTVNMIPFHREFFIFRIAYRIKWFEVAASFNVTPSTVELGLDGERMEMDRYNFLMSLGAVF
ncbi:hypothetical protein J6Z19_00365 [bacterium]|nr:hypothetical protein [bacterium]